MTAWLKRRMAQALGRPVVPPRVEEPEPAPMEFGTIAQSARVLALAHRYRQELKRAAEIRAREQEARAQRDREARQAAFEDTLARSLAQRWSHFPGDDDEARTPQPGEFTPLEGEWGQEGRYGWWRFPR